MPLDEFWHGDVRLLEAYQKAYMRNVSYTAWFNGMYNRIAVEIGAKNALITKKSEHIDTWIDFVDPVIKTIDDGITKENLEEHYRVQQAEQNAWLFH